MKALTICQPWAWAIIHGPKPVENRGWATKYRGPLAIHAGQSRGRPLRPGR
ncbi:MAG: ASCH domain-containing protein [Planctomycetota bacterium]